MTALSDVLRDANTAGLSARAIARVADERGHSLNHDTAARYLRGDHGRPDEATLVAFADILKVPLAKLRRAADLPAEQTAPYTPPAEASRLTRRQRRAVDEIIRAMLEPRSADVTDLDPARSGPSRRATRAPQAPQAPRAAGAARSHRAARHGDPEQPGS